MAIEPVALTLREVILQRVEDRGEEGRTIEEVSLETGIQKSTVCGRIGELKRAGLVMDSGLRRPGVSGVEHKVFVVCVRVVRPAHNAVLGRETRPQRKELSRE